MFDINNFKRSVKDYMKTHPDATVDEMQDYCEELIPTVEYQQNSWIVEQTLEWYRFVLESRSAERSFDDEELS